jgi:antitoxin component YwqK of YwqJK toxin-antitoxin module
MSCEIKAIYYPTGEVKSSACTIDGVKNGPKVTFRLDGSVKRITLYKDDKREGTQVWYSIAHHLEEHVEFKNGSRNGKWVMYDMDGFPLIIKHYKDGELHGEAAYYDHSHLLKARDLYDKGRLVVEKE